jgi:predicted SAM-dependent methyltransferase
MQQTKINLACGNTYVTDNGWINLDYNSTSPSVRRADLLGRLDLPDGGAELVYSSHFLEHIPRSEVSGFLGECFRVLAPGGGYDWFCLIWKTSVGPTWNIVTWVSTRRLILLSWR